MEGVAFRTSNDPPVVHFCKPRYSTISSAGARGLMAWCHPWSAPSRMVPGERVDRGLLVGSSWGPVLGGAAAVAGGAVPEGGWRGAGVWMGVRVTPVAAVPVCSMRRVP